MERDMNKSKSNSLLNAASVFKADSVFEVARFAFAVSAVATSMLAVSVGSAWSQVTLDAASQALYDKAAQEIPGLPVEIFAGAQKEGELTIYRVGYDFPGIIFPEFKKLFPFIAITEFEATVAPLLQRFSAEARSGRNVADVVMNAIPGAVNALDKEGLIAHYKPTSADAIKTGFREGAYYPFDRIMLCNAYNSDLVTDAQAAGLGSWNAIGDLQWTGKVGINRMAAGGVTALAYTFVDKEKPTDFETLIVKQDALLFPSVPTMIERLASGGISVAFFANDGNLHKLKRAGAPLKWKCPTPGLVLNDFQFIPAKAPHPNAARLWIEFMLSKKGQQLVNEGLGLGPARIDVADKRAVTGEAWYQAPAELYSFSWDEVDKGLEGVRAKWDAAAGKARLAN
ncbi:putative Solute-binding protein [Hyphomicrobiales bacterium]|nr:putative Solute-binding protein [Hyphomicrobiales bacterium]CAH1691828.1 putative Solute-binding protein [Hyphomicrobiales bacterium]